MQAGSSATMQKVPQPSKPTWVSVQDVVLNSLRPSTQPSQLLPELSHFYTHKHRNALLMSLWFLLVCHALTQKWCGVASWHVSVNFTKAIKNTCPHKKSLHQDMVCLFKQVWVFENCWNISSTKTWFMTSPSDLLATPVLNAFQNVALAIVIERQTN